MPRNIGFALLCAAGVALNLLILGPNVVRAGLAGASDFQAAYVGAAIPHSPYDPDTIARVQTQVFGRPNDQLLPIRLPFYFALLSPLARLDYSRAHVIWMILLFAATIVFTYILNSKDRSYVALACCWSLPLVAGLFVINQDVPFLLLILAIALRLRTAGKAFEAGCVLALVLIKFHLFLLLPLPFLRFREWRLLAGWSAGVAVLLAISFAVAGISWPIDYFHLIVREANVNISTQSVMPTLHGISRHFHWGIVAEAGLSAIAAALTIWAVRRNSFETGLAAALLGSYLISRHGYMQDCAVFLPSLVMIAGGDNFAQLAAVALLLPVTYVFVLTGQVWVVTIAISALLVALAVQPIALKPVTEAG